jgi:hypothetical protein
MWSMHTRLGLWCADSYWWSSSIGLSNVEPVDMRFGGYLAKILEPERLRLRIYRASGSRPDARVLGLTDRVTVCAGHKMRRTAYHVYVNSRPLVRRFFSQRERLDEVAEESLGPYFAGRFDGDGSFGDTPRIAYTTCEEAKTGTVLLARAGIVRTSVLFYKSANEYCIYIHRANMNRLNALIQPFSWKAGRRFTL